MTPESSRLTSMSNVEHDHHECPRPDEDGDGGPDVNRTLPWACGECGRRWLPTVSSQGIAFWTEVQGPQPRWVAFPSPELPELEIGSMMGVSPQEWVVLITIVIVAVLGGLLVGMAIGG